MENISTQTPFAVYDQWIFLDVLHLLNRIHSQFILPDQSGAGSVGEGSPYCLPAWLTEQTNGPRGSTLTK